VISATLLLCEAQIKLTNHRSTQLLHNDHNTMSVDTLLGCLVSRWRNSRDLSSAGLLDLTFLYALVRTHHDSTESLVHNISLYTLLTSTLTCCFS